jgi:AraC-like DNA-binding protein
MMSRVQRRFLRTPDLRLRPLLYRPLYGFEQENEGFASWLEPPRPAVTLMVDFEGSITANGEPLPNAWMGGLDQSYTIVGVGRRYASLDLELTPLGAYTVLGQPMTELAGQCVPLVELFGPELIERLREASVWEERFDVIERFLLARATAGPRPTPAVDWAVARLHQTGGGARIATLAAELGCSRRYLTRRFADEVGLPPKALARQIRFARVCARLRQEPTAWARLASEAGYCDQAHLSRDFRELAGTTPTDFVARLLPGGGVVGDGVAFIQDRASAQA